MKNSIEVLIEQEKIEKKITELAATISRDYANCDSPLVVLGLLKGSVIFMSDLIKELSIPIVIDFMSVSSYSGGMESTGIVKILKDVDIDLKNRRILIVEDIIDTGLTLDYVKKFLFSKGAAEIKVCALLTKPSRRKIDLEGEYVGFEVPDVFLVGYGLDYMENYRNFPYVAKLTVRQ